MAKCTLVASQMLGLAHIWLGLADMEEHTALENIAGRSISCISQKIAIDLFGPFTSYCLSLGQFRLCVIFG